MLVKKKSQDSWSHTIKDELRKKTDFRTRRERYEDLSKMNNHRIYIDKKKPVLKKKLGFRYTDKETTF